MSSPPGAWRPLLLRWGPLAVIAGALVWHALRFDFVTDDAYISFVFSRNLAEHGELTFNPGDPVEGYTNFLWTLILGIGMMLGVPPELGARVLGAAFAIGTLVVAFRLTERLIDEPRRVVGGGGPAGSAGGAGGEAPRAIGRREDAPASPWAYAPPLLLALSSGFACWTSGGLETQLFTFLVALAVDGYVAADVRPRALARVGLWLALAAMTRPEGLLVAAVLGAHRLAMNLALRRRGQPAWRRAVPDADELLCVASFLVVWAPWFAWRWWYYGWPFPNTFYVKAAGATTPAFDEALAKAGRYYVEQWATQVKLWWAAPLLLLGAIPRAVRSPRFTFVTLAIPLAAAYLLYAVRVGGDFMGLHRFIMPVFVVVAVLVVLGLERGAGLVPAGARRWAAPAAAALVVAAFGWSQARLTRASLDPPRGRFADRGIDTPAYLIAYTNNRAAIGRAMRPCFRDGDFSIVGGAGAQPYFGRMRAIDVFGLVSSRIAHEVPPRNPRPGHTKWGPDPLLAEHDPTFVFHCYSIHSAPAARPLGCGGYWRARGFEQVTLQVPGLDGLREDRDDTRGAGPVADRYTFLVRADRAFACPGLTRDAAKGPR